MTLKKPRPPNYLKAHAAILSRTEARREVLRPIALELRDQGLSLAAIARELEERGYRTARAGRWHKATVLRLLAVNWRKSDGTENV